MRAGQAVVRDHSRGIHGGYGLFYTRIPPASGLARYFHIVPNGTRPAKELLNRNTSEARQQAAGAPALLFKLLPESSRKPGVFLAGFPPERHGGKNYR